jgi:hypothetical protein
LGSTYSTIRSRAFTCAAILGGGDLELTLLVTGHSTDREAEELVALPAGGVVLVDRSLGYDRGAYSLEEVAELRDVLATLGDPDTAEPERFEHVSFQVARSGLLVGGFDRLEHIVALRFLLDRLVLNLGLLLLGHCASSNLPQATLTATHSGESLAAVHSLLALAEKLDIHLCVRTLEPLGSSRLLFDRRERRMELLFAPESSTRNSLSLRDLFRPLFTSEEADRDPEGIEGGLLVGLV